MVLNMMKQANRKIALMKIRQSVEMVYNQRRLIFKDNDNVEYAEKGGVAKIFTLDELSSHLWLAMDSEIIKATKASLTMLDITPDSVKEIILKLPRRITEVK